MSASTMKNMLIFLTLHTNVSALYSSPNLTVADHIRISYIESKIGDLFMEHDMVDTHADHESEIQWLKTKIDMEDYSRRNTTFRSIPETVATPHPPCADLTN